MGKHLSDSRFVRKVARFKFAVLNRPVYLLKGRQDDNQQRKMHPSVPCSWLAYGRSHVGAMTEDCWTAEVQGNLCLEVPR